MPSKINRTPFSIFFRFIRNLRAEKETAESIVSLLSGSVKKDNSAIFNDYLVSVAEELLIKKKPEPL